MFLFFVYRQLWKFLQQITRDAEDMTEYVSKHQEAACNLLKKAPDNT